MYWKQRLKTRKTITRMSLLPFWDFPEIGSKARYLNQVFHKPWLALRGVYSGVADIVHTLRVVLCSHWTAFQMKSRQGVG